MGEINPDVLAEVREALAPLPTEDGGTIVVLATAGKPPAVAMLSSGDVLVGADRVVRAALYGGASAARRLGGAFALLVPVGERAMRVEVVAASARPVGELAVLEGELTDVRPTAEPPWAIDMHFFPTSSEGTADHVRYWREVRGWLEDGARGEPPATPAAPSG